MSAPRRRPGLSRRSWIVSAAAATGALVVGWSLLPPRSRMGHATQPWTRASDSGPIMGIALNGWIRIAPDGSVVLAMPRSEMGQGVHTALAMLAAEELDVSLDKITLEQAGADTIYGNVTMFVATLPFHPTETDIGLSGAPDMRPVKVQVGEWMVSKVARELGLNVTGGSTSVADAWDVLRTAAATARAALLGAASLQWRLPSDDLFVRDGVISHPSGRSAHYGEMVKFAAAGPVPGNVKLKNRADWKLIGRSAPRTDLQAKVDGSAVFGLDVRLPGMVYAAVRQCPMLGGAPGVIHSDAALAQPGVERVVRLPSDGGSTSGFAVVGKTWWHAEQAAGKVYVEWQQRPAGPLDSRVIEKTLLAAVAADEGFTFFATGDVDRAEAGAARLIDAHYTAPFLAHATLEPMNCTAQIKNGHVHLWLPTQVPQMAARLAAQIAGVPLDNVHVTVTYLGGGFGRRLEVDVAGQAVRVAMECGGRPVQLIWSREEDMTHDFYRPMHVAALRAGVDAQGKVVSLRIKSAGDAISPRWMKRTIAHLTGPIDVPDKTTSEGLFDLPYLFADQKMSQVATRLGVPVGFWRSVGHSHNAFFSESFIDELAYATGADPLQFRRSLLSKAPKHLAVLNLAAERAGWGAPLPAGRARGIALHESFNSIVAQVVELSQEGASPRVHRVVCAIDCGTVINPGIVSQQMEGAIIFGLTAALFGKIDIDAGVVQQQNFSHYRMIALARAPHVEIHLVVSERTPGGVGEPGVPPLAPALANAWYALTGARVRSLPIEGRRTDEM